jgi:hypothetical protein
MPRACSVCKKMDANLARDIARAESNRTIADRHNLTPSAVQRHRVNCNQARHQAVREPSKAAARKSDKTGRFDSDGRCPSCHQVTDDKETLEPDALVRRAERLLAVAENIATRAEADNDNRLCLLALDRAQRSLDTLCKMAGLLKPDSVTIVDARTTNIYADWATASLQALNTFHDVLASGQSVEEAIAAVKMPDILALPKPNEVGVVER